MSSYKSMRHTVSKLVSVAIHQYRMNEMQLYKHRIPTTRSYDKPIRRIYMEIKTDSAIGLLDISNMPSTEEFMINKRDLKKYRN